MVGQVEIIESNSPETCSDQSVFYNADKCEQAEILLVKNLLV